ncbi:hypothetical protein ACSMXN_22100 [Jatrophihabitans sp. DSM 45814]
MVDRLPFVGDEAMDSYLAVLDSALLDRLLSVTEARALVEVASSLGLGRAEAGDAHRRYLDALAAAAWEDGVVTDTEQDDLIAVASMLGLSADDARASIEDKEPSSYQGRHASPEPTVPHFALSAGDQVVFTGDMDRDRASWESEATAAGLTPHPGVTKKTRLVVAADPDSLSGKAAQARRYKIPIVTEAAFEKLLARITP